MPRMVAPPPSGEFQVVLSKPFDGESLPMGVSKDRKKHEEMLIGGCRRANTHDRGHWRAQPLCQHPHDQLQR